jgi:muconolactone delta-isomerase
MHTPAARHADRAFVRRAVHPQNPRAVVLVADTGAYSSATAAIAASQADDAAEMVAVLESLPIYGWISTEAMPLATHPEDPATTRLAMIR